jgi:ATP adenylyltransferase
MEYILSAKKAGCPFCEELEKPDGPINLIIHRAEYCFVILNRYPYTSGHLMVVPYVHCSTLEDLSVDIRAEMMELTTQATRVLKSVYLPQGFNLGINLGEVAGAGILDHVHIHIVPRWNGDTNFMTTIAKTRLIAELLEDGYCRIKEGWEKLV